MDRIFRVKTNNGYIKEFTDEKLALEFEAKMKKEHDEEIERQKIAEEKRKKLAQYKETKLKEINESLHKSKMLVDDYEKTTGAKLIYTNDLSTGNIVIKEARNSIDYAWNDFFDDIFKVIRTK